MKPELRAQIRHDIRMFIIVTLAVIFALLLFVAWSDRAEAALLGDEPVTYAQPHTTRRTAQWIHADRSARTTTLAPVVTAPVASATSTSASARSGSTARSVAGVGYGPDILHRIMMCESGGRATAQNSRSTASGLFQVLDSTWDGYAGFARAMYAPPDTQWAWAREAYAASGTRPWLASRHCWGR